MMLQRCGLGVLLLLMLGYAQALAPLHNQLADNPSPYLAMHGHDPVAWQEWSAALLERARQENRLIFISSGYFSCHWCHVMQRESYQNKAIAAVLNTGFIPVKVDRELEPALDAHLIEFVELTRGHAGWPLNVILTPDGYPLLGFTYLPPEQFRSVLENLQARWQKDHAQLTELARQGVEQIRAIKQQVTRADSGEPVEPIAAFLSGSDEIRDELAGGFGQQSKFPMTPQLQLLMKLSASKQHASQQAFVRLTLDNMQQLGLRDHLGEGFFRYSTDPSWQVPHYEKMLYDNAQLAVLYLSAATRFGEPRYRATGLATLDFILTEMRGKKGGYVGSFSAVDEQGREGYYYLWSDEQLKQALDSDELKVARAWWSLQGPLQTEYGYLPVRRQSPDEVARTLDLPLKTLEARVASARQKLLAKRRQRSLPVDSKQLAAWNGLLLSALSRAATLSDEQRYKDAGRKLANYLSEELWDGKRLARAMGDAGAIGRASAEDYALVAKGLSDWTAVAPEPDHKPLIRKLVRQAWSAFYRDGRWFQSDEASLPGLGGKLAFTDNPLPSASAVLTGLARSDPVLKKNRPLQSRVNEHLQQVRDALTDSLFWYASYVDLLAAEK